MCGKRTFLIYGAASDIIAPIFEHFSDDDFICFVNHSRPSYLKGHIIGTGAENFEENLP